MAGAEKGSRSGSVAGQRQKARATGGNRSWVARATSMLEQNSAGATNSSTSASRRSSRPGHLPRVLLSTVMPAAAEPSFLRQRSVEGGGQAGLAARRLVEGRLQAAFEVAAQDRKSTRLHSSHQC